jgi:hypothetical protein
MRTLKAVTSVVVGLAMLTVPAAAAPLAFAPAKNFATPAQADDESPVLQIQYRRGYRGGYRNRDRGDDGAGVAAGIVGGLLLGAIIANEAQRGNRTVDYCVRRFRSYDPQSGTYLGNDGYRHRCP